MTSFTDVFGGSAVLPSDVMYELITITTPVQLEWPALATSTDNVAARIIEVSAASGSPVVKLPDARLASLGQDILFRNTGSVAVSVQTFSGASLLSISSGEAKYIYLVDASTSGGSWTIIAFGVGVGSVDASQLAGLGLEAITTTLNVDHPVSNVSGGFTIQLTDRARLYNFTGGASILSLLSAVAYGNGFFFMVSNGGSGAVTIDPAGIETIDGASSLDINPGESAIVLANGSSWYTVGRGRSILFQFTQLVKDVSGNSNVTLTSTEASNKVIKLIGAITGDIAVIVPNVVSLYIINNVTSGAFSITLKTAAGTGVVVPQNNRQILYCDGTDVLQAITVAIATTGFADGTSAAPSITFSADTDTGFFRAGTNTVGITSGGISQVTIDTTGVHAANITSDSLATSLAMS